jgi:hypothetical protein
MLRQRMAALVLILMGMTAVVWAPQAKAADSGFSIYAGGFAGGRLFTATSSAERAWLSPDGRDFRGVEVRAEVDETFVAGLRIQKAMGKQWGLTANFSGADADISVLVRTNQANVDKVLWDQVFVFSTELTAFYDLVETGNRAYVFGGAGLSMWSGVEDSGLSQTRPSAVLGVGYRIQALIFDIDLEARDSIVFSNFDDEQARLNVDDANFDGNPPTMLWSFTAGWSYNF